MRENELRPRCEVDQCTNGRTIEKAPHCVVKPVLRIPAKSISSSQTGDEPHGRLVRRNLHQTDASIEDPPSQHLDVGVDRWILGSVDRLPNCQQIFDLPKKVVTEPYQPPAGASETVGPHCHDPLKHSVMADEPTKVNVSAYAGTSPTLLRRIASSHARARCDPVMRIDIRASETERR